MTKILSLAVSILCGLSLVTSSAFAATAEEKMILGNKLISAISSGNIPEVQLALLLGADPDYQTEQKRSDRLTLIGPAPLHYAALGCKSEIVKILIARKANVNATQITETDIYSNATPLMYAASYSSSNPECVLAARLLLAAGADPQIQTRLGEKALHLATKMRSSNSDLIQLLLAAPYGAKYSREDLGKALYFATSNAHLHSIEALLTAGSDPNAYSGEFSNRSVLEVALKPWTQLEPLHYVKIVQLLISHGAKSPDAIGTALENVALLARPLVQALIQSGIEPATPHLQTGVEAYIRAWRNPDDSVDDAFMTLSILAKGRNVDVNPGLRYSFHDTAGNYMAGNTRILRLLVTAPSFNPLSAGARGAYCDAIQSKMTEAADVLARAGVQTGCDPVSVGTLF